MVAVDRLELVVVRHGLTAWNRQRRYQGRRDIPLLMPDSVPAMDRLRRHLADQDFDAVYASDLTRCRQTLAHLSEGRTWPAPRFDARLRELDFGAYEGRTYDELKDLAGYRAWIDSQGESAPRTASPPRRCASVSPPGWQRRWQRPRRSGIGGYWRWPMAG
ncbi:phosphoserine phosphatase 1 [Halomonas elongata]|uniref:Phosphoserine phosphatase 1 n=1 Tax=Halomonas elongata TaxID=2746 RepID=A0A1B8P579_HALEL|nr:phosphoserine phosphatase 1 [Halomonas elongata]